MTANVERELRALCERYEQRDARTPVGSGRVSARMVLTVLDGKTADEAYKEALCSDK